MIKNVRDIVSQKAWSIYIAAIRFAFENGIDNPVGRTALTAARKCTNREKKLHFYEKNFRGVRKKFQNGGL